MDEATLARELSRAYWQSEDSVARIADMHGVTRRMVYDLLSPLSAGGTCARCGGRLVYRNRSARAMGRAECESCGVEAEPGARPAGRSGLAGWIVVFAAVAGVIAAVAAWYSRRSWRGRR